MQHSFVHKTTARIAARNDPARIRVRLTLGFSFWYLAAFICGLLLCRSPMLAALPALREGAAAMLSSPFEDCHIARHYVQAVLREAGPHLTALILMALSGITMFSPTACRMVLAVHALFCGISAYVSAGIPMMGNADIPHPALAFFGRFFALFFIGITLIDVACEADIFSYSYRDACRDLRHKGDALSVRYILRMLSAAGTVILITAAWAIFVAILEL